MPNDGKVGKKLLTSQHHRKPQRDLCKLRLPNPDSNEHDTSL